MAKINNLLTTRLKKATDKLTKMTGLAELSSSGQLSTFSGMFRVTPLSDIEKEKLHFILSEYSQGEDQNISGDLTELLSITSEVRAISNQAAILHGERIKKAQEILKKYKDGAFTAWLISTYGNRQTPYNFLQYFELFRSLPTLLHPKLDEMPRQVVYALASRAGPLDKKEEIVKNFQGETKQELLSLIRKEFPLAQTDKRAQDLAEVSITALKRLQKVFKDISFQPTNKQKDILLEHLKTLRLLIKESELA
jgi:hypothetical protein